MAVRVISAPPGQGKTLNMTRIAIQIFKEQNPFFHRLKDDSIYYNSIYSNYPILVWYQKKPFKYACSGCPNKIFDSVPIKKVYDEEVDQEYYQECPKEEAERFGMFSQKVKFIGLR